MTALSLATSLWRGYRRGRRERAILVSLDALSDRTLKDIGLDRRRLGAAAGSDLTRY